MESRSPVSGSCGAKSIIVVVPPTIAFCNEQIEIFVARDLVKTKQHLDEGEFVEVVEYTIEELIDKLKGIKLKK